MAAKITADGMWRVTYGDIPGLSNEDYKKRLPMRYQQILPGNPKIGEYEVTNIGPYKMHQRLAPKLRVGRILLAADAAHLCNPFGGFGLIGGIADVSDLSQCLPGIHNGNADDEILDKYDEVCSSRHRTVVDRLSTLNFQRLWMNDPESTANNDPWLSTVRKATHDKGIASELQKSSLDLLYDFTQHYNP
ncbi:hypothetical protein N7449_008314 [Penicillium cf. viridicatum]|uniref:FAD-binding domain-containing protein n=1 Tax=Penicillium cf. viridicatum TaxID=2972119 RepID=A0A9W9M9M3_9EURO|nr:hypothetical protein N7449_008314 [Penicillium cf. viridicatum]